jgi:hypothetical protein
MKPVSSSMIVLFADKFAKILMQTNRATPLRSLSQLAIFYADKKVSDAGLTLSI